MYMHKTPNLLKRIEELGLVIGVRLKILSVSRYDQVMRIHVQGQKEVAILGPAITNRVFVEIL